MQKQFPTAFTLYLIVAVGVVVLACNRQQIASYGTDFVGVYALISVNGERVPTSISHEGTTLRVLSGTLTINADRTCRSRTVLVSPSGPEVVREVTATYTKDGSELTMQWKDAGKTVGTIEGNTLTMNNEGLMFAYNK